MNTTKFRPKAALAAAALLSAFLLAPAPARADDPPPVFKRVNASRWLAGKVRVAWLEAADSSGVGTYDVLRHDPVRNEFVPLATGVTGTWYDDTTTQSGSVYRYIVRTRNKDGLATDSSVVYGYNGDNRPCIPVVTSFTASRGTYEDKVRVSWTMSSYVPTYDVFRHNDGTNAGTRIAAAITDTWFEDTTAVPGVKYAYDVRPNVWAIYQPFELTMDLPEPDDGGWAGSVPDNPELPPEPGVWVSVYRWDGIYLAWSVSGKNWSYASPKTYNVYRKPYNGDYGTNGFVRIAQGVVGTAYLDTDPALVPGKDYVYWVEAVNANGTRMSDPSRLGHKIGFPPVFADTEASQGTYSDKVRIDWSEAPGSSGTGDYEILRLGVDEPGGYIHLGHTTNTWYEDTTAVPGVAYRYMIETTNSYGYYSHTYTPDLYGWVAVRPDNDDFENARAISGESGSDSCANANATFQGGEGEVTHFSFMATNTVWWTWTAPADGTVQFNTADSQKDDGTQLLSMVAVYTGGSLGSLEPIGLGLVSYSNSFAVASGTVCHIQASGLAPSEVGTICLNWSYVPKEPERPDNDDFEDAWAISSKSGSSASTNIYATFQTDEPYPAGVTTANRTVWWSYAAPLDGMVQFNTDGSVDPFSPEGDGPKDGILTALAIYTGDALASLEEVCSGTPYYDPDAGMGYNWCSNAFEVASGTVYRVQASGYGEYEFDEMTQKWAEEWGLIRLNWSYTHYRVTFDPNGGTISTNAVMVPVGQKLGDAMASFPVPVREGYRFVDWKFENNASVSASAAFAITESHALHAEWAYISSNDDFEDALPLDSPGQTSGVSAVSNTNATLQAGEPLLAAYPNATHTLWWSWTAPANGTAHFATTNSVDEHGSQIDTVIGVYTGSALGSLAQVATGDDGVNDSGFIDDIGTRWSFVDFEATKGTTYYVCVGVNDKLSQQVVEGTIRVNWSLVTSGVGSGGYALLPPGSSGVDIPPALGGSADPSLEDILGGDVDAYNDFAEWANGMGADDVRASSHSAASYLLGTTALLQNNPVITINGMEVKEGVPIPTRRGSPSDGISLTLTVSVTDGGEPVEVTAAKVAKLFEATTDLSDWESPATKLDPHAEAITEGSDTTVTIRVTPGDGTAPQAFLRIRR